MGWHNRVAIGGGGGGKEQLGVTTANQKALEAPSSLAAVAAASAEATRM